jgi:hypothetical protein
LYAYDLTKAYWVNSIIYGDKDNEILLDSYGDATFDYCFQNCLLKTDVNNLMNTRFISSVFNKKPLFTNTNKNDYSIDSLSSARNIGDKDIAERFAIDLNNNSRLEDEGPDLGAIEWVSSESE